MAETWGQRLSAYDLLPDGSAARPRVWADLRPNVPDGLAVDAEGAVWVADPVLKGLMRVIEGVGAVEWIPTGDHPAYACALGRQRRPHPVGLHVGDVEPGPHGPRAQRPHRGRPRRRPRRHPRLTPHA